MLKPLIASLTLLSFSIPALAEVQIKAPEEIIVLAIDGQEIRNNLFSKKDRTYTLDDGQHNISIQYKQFFNPTYISHEVVKSGIVTLSTGQLTAGRYELVLLNPPQDLDAAKQFAEQPKIGLKDQKGQIVAQQTGGSVQSTSLLGQGIFSSVLDLRKSPTQEVKQPTALEQSTTSVVQQIKSDILSKDQQLIELWKNATTQERQKFTAWLGEQAAK